MCVRLKNSESQTNKQTKKKKHPSDKPTVPNDAPVEAFRPAMYAVAADAVVVNPAISAALLAVTAASRRLAVAVCPCAVVRMRAVKWEDDALTKAVVASCRRRGGK